MNINKQTIDSLKNIRSGNIAPLYLYGTEHISKYYSKLDLNNKKVLTIIGSGDQALNAFFYGAKKRLFVLILTSYQNMFFI